MMTELKPLAYGSIRMQCDVDDHITRDTELRLRRCAEAEGYEFAAIFNELQPGAYSAWDELMRELQRADAHDVFVPSIRHVARNRIFRRCLLDRLDEDASGSSRTHRSQAE